MASIIKRVWTSRGPTGHRVKKVSFGYTVQVQGKQERRFCGSWSRQDAQEALAGRLLARDAPAAPVRAKTLGELAMEYLDYKRAKGKKTIIEDERDLRRFIAEWGADTPAAEVTSKLVAQYDRKRITETSRLGRPIAASSVNRELATLRHMLRLAEEWEYIDKAPKIRMGKEPEGRLRFLDEAEASRLLDACSRSKNVHLATIVTIALATGMRKGEIMGLTWERVDFSRGVLLLETTKNGKRREVPMNLAVDEALSQFPGMKEGVVGPVFTTASGARWRSIRTAFERACEAAEVADFRFHDLRHTFASWLVMKGRSLKEVQELLGHRTLAMTMRYAHLSPDRLREAVAATDSFFSARSAAFSTKSAQSTVESPSAGSSLAVTS